MDKQKEKEHFLALVFSRDKNNLRLAEQLAEGQENLQVLLDKIKEAHEFFFREGSLEEHLQKEILSIYKWEYFDECQKQVDEYLPELQNIKKLLIHKSALWHLPKNIGNLQNLKQLGANCYCLKELPESLFSLQNLEHLSLKGNAFEEISPRIGELQNLKVLSLKKNQISRLPKSISRLQKLSFLNLYGNPISKSERDKIKSWLPNCQLVWQTKV